MLDLFLPAPSLLIVPHLSFGWLMACQCQAQINYDQPLLHSLYKGQVGTAEEAVPTVSSNSGCVKAVLAAYPCGWPAGAFATWPKNSSLHCTFFLGVLKYQTEDPGLGVHMHTCGAFKCLQGSHLDSWKPLAMGTGCWPFDRQLDGAATTALAPGVSSETWTKLGQLYYNDCYIYRFGRVRLKHLPPSRRGLQ